MRLWGVLVLAAVAALVAPAGATASLSPAAIEAELGSGVNVSRNDETGRIGFIGTDPGQSIEMPAAGARQTALGFIDSYAAEFGIDDASRELEVTAVNKLDDGRASVRLQQVQAGIPILGGELIVNLDSAGNVLSASGELEPKPAPTTESTVRSAEADDVALASVAKGYEVSAGDLVASDPELWVYDSRTLGGPGLDTPRLVWRIEVTDGTDATPIRELVLVDAEDAVVALSFSQIADAKSRAVCNGANVPGAQANCQPAGFVRNDSDIPTGDSEVDPVYNRTGGVYDFYAGLGRDSLNDAGMKLISTVRFCRADSLPTCPYKNAFWNGAQMTYGQDVITDDIVAHELTHGFTEFTSNLFYYYQSGAINESISDVFGELFDQSFEAEPPADRWKIGEGSSLGVIRNMADPPLNGDPDRMNSPLYAFDAGQADAGGVHTNSGVNNKATFLLTDGGTFNGQTVTGLGADKVLHLYYEVNSNLLGSASDYLDLANALEQACANLTGQFGIVAADCAEVTKAVAATEMRAGPVNSPTRTAGTCLTAGDVPNFVFDDNLENPASGNWASAAVSVPGDEWFYPSSLRYATSGIRMLRGQTADADPPGGDVGDYAIALTSNVTVPPGGFLRFNHAYGFDDTADNVTRFDGGVLEYSVDSGVSWTDASALFAFGGYNGTIEPGFGNPLSSRAAFTGESNGYGSSRLDLNSLSGQPLRIRFRIGTDISVGDRGWFIDDVQIYNCPPETSIDSGPDEGSTIQVNSTLLEFSATDPSATLECSFDAVAFAACTSPANPSGLADGAHAFAVRGIDATGAIDPTPATRSFTVDTRCPRALEALKAAKKKLKKAKKKLKKAKQSGDQNTIKKAKKKVKKAKKKVRQAQAFAVSVCP